jgi:1-phosphofructokinase
MIVTLTANPSVDRTIEVGRVRRGAVVRALGNRVDAGGKGVNVARALAAHGQKATAVVASGGAEGAQLEALLTQTATGLDVVAVPVGGATRANVTVVESDGTTTKLNEPGPRLSKAELAALADALTDAAARADWVVLCGSLPPGAPTDWYAGLTRRIKATNGCRVAVDTSGAALARAVDAAPDLAKPNRDELADLTGRSIATLTDAVEAARSLGLAAVLVSLGPDGAVLVTATGAWHATAPRVEPKSTVGAGDAALAGYLAAGADGPAGLVEAVAWGSAATALDGTRMPTADDVCRDGITVTDLIATGGTSAASRLSEQS